MYVVPRLCLIQGSFEKHRHHGLHGNVWWWSIRSCSVWFPFSSECGWKRGVGQPWFPFIFINTFLCITWKNLPTIYPNYIAWRISFGVEPVRTAQNSHTECWRVKLTRLFEALFIESELGVLHSDWGCACVHHDSEFPIRIILNLFIVNVQPHSVFYLCDFGVLVHDYKAFLIFSNGDALG